MKAADNLIEAVAELAAGKALEQLKEQMKHLNLGAPDRSLDVLEAANYIGISKELLYRMAADKQIPHIRYGAEGTRRPRLIFSTLTLDNWRREQEEKNYTSVK